MDLAPFLYGIARGVSNYSGNGGSTDLGYSITFDGEEFLTFGAIYDNMPLDFDVNTPSPIFMSDQLSMSLGYPAIGGLLPFSLVGTDDVLLIEGADLTLNGPIEITAIPVPPALLLFVSGLLTVFGRRSGLR